MNRPEYWEDDEKWAQYEAQKPMPPTEPPPEFMSQFKALIDKARGHRGPPTSPITFGNENLVQLHWQNPVQPDQTEFVAQGEFADTNAMHAWAMEVIERRRCEKPTGWVPMLCTSGDSNFVWAAR